MTDLHDTLATIAQKALQNTLAPSLSICAVKDGEVAFEQAFGDAHPGSVYGIASVTKQFTCACVLLLARDGAISLEDRVSKWLPELTRADEITVRELLAHTSGYPDYYPLGFADEEKLHDTPPSEIVRRYATGELQFDPGSAWSYSNTGFHIAGLIVERITSRRFGEVLTEKVLAPAGMSSTFFNDPPARDGRVIRGFTRYCMGPQRPTDGERSGWTYAAGGLASTARDLARWHTVLMNRSLLTETEIAQLATPFTFNDGKPSPMGLGFFVENRGGYPTLQHSGGIAGFSSLVILSLEEKCSVTVLANGDHVPTGAICSQLFEAVLPGATPPALPPVENAEHAQQVALRWIDRFKRGNVDPTHLEPALKAYLTEERLQDAVQGLGNAGDVLAAEALASGERGGMPWYRVRITFACGKTDVVLRETAGGNLAEFNAYALP